jgi:hypothetical protein
LLVRSQPPSMQRPFWRVWVIMKKLNGNGSFIDRRIFRRAPAGAVFGDHDARHDPRTSASVLSHR